MSPKVKKRAARVEQLKSKYSIQILKLTYLSNIAVNNLHNRSVVVIAATNNKEREPLLLRDVQRKLELGPLPPLRTLVLEPIHAPDYLGVSHLKFAVFLLFYLLVTLSVRSLLLL